MDDPAIQTIEIDAEQDGPDPTQSTESDAEPVSETTAPELEASRPKKSISVKKPASSSEPSTSSEPSQPPVTDLANKSSVKGKVKSDVKLNGKTVVITGANQGIGYETAFDLAGRGAKVIMACRNVELAKKAKNEILKVHSKAKIDLKRIDLSSLDSVRNCAEKIIASEDRLDILINNAGIMMCPYWKTKEGYEMQLGVNHIGHFLFTNLLLDLLKKSAPSRIIILSSMAYRRGTINWNDVMYTEGYEAAEAYCASKLANILHCKELSRRLEGTGVTCNCVHPGVVRTNLFQHGKGNHVSSSIRAMLCVCWCCLRLCGSISPKEGAQTSIYCAIAPELKTVSGEYFNLCTATPLEANALDEEDAKKLWMLSEDWVKLPDHVKD